MSCIEDEPTQPPALYGDVIVPVRGMSCIDNRRFAAVLLGGYRPREGYELHQPHKPGERRGGQRYRPREGYELHRQK